MPTFRVRAIEDNGPGRASTEIVVQADDKEEAIKKARERLDPGFKVRFEAELLKDFDEERLPEDR